MGAISMIFFVPVPLNVAFTTLPIFSACLPCGRARVRPRQRVPQRLLVLRRQFGDAGIGGGRRRRGGHRPARRGS